MVIGNREVLPSQWALFIGGDKVSSMMFLREQIIDSILAKKATLFDEDGNRSVLNGSEIKEISFLDFEKLIKQLIENFVDSDFAIYSWEQNKLIVIQIRRLLEMCERNRREEIIEYGWNSQCTVLKWKQNLVYLIFLKYTGENIVNKIAGIKEELLSCLQDACLDPSISTSFITEMNANFEQAVRELGHELGEVFRRNWGGILLE